MDMAFKFKMETRCQKEGCSLCPEGLKGFGCGPTPRFRKIDLHFKVGKIICMDRKQERSDVDMNDQLSA